jgi:hypothetical protein
MALDARSASRGDRRQARSVLYAKLILAILTETLLGRVLAPSPRWPPSWSRLTGCCIGTRPRLCVRCRRANDARRPCSPAPPPR